MTSLFILIIFVVLAAFALNIFTSINQKNKKEKEKEERKKASEAKQYDYDKKSQFLTRAERKLHKELKSELSSEYEIFANVRLNDVIQPRKGTYYKGANGRINQMHVDFIITDTESKILMAIELDGDSHNNETQKQRDENKETFFKSANLPFIRLKNNDSQNIKLITDMLAAIANVNVIEEASSNIAES